MKNKAQIKHYLENKSYATDFDFTMISSYCSQQLNVNLEKPKPSPDMYPITCQEFIDWVNNGFEAGTVVIYNDFQGIIVNSNPKEVTIYSKTDFKVPNFDFLTVSIQDIQPSPESLANRFYEILRDSGHEFNMATLEIAEKYIPEKDDIVAFSHIQSLKDKSYGIFREAVDGIAYMYCYCNEKDEVFYGPSLRESVGRIENLQFTKISPQDYGRKKLEALLNKQKMSWNHSGKRIESVNMRGEKGSPYCYINDKMEVVTSKDDQGTGTAATRRYWVGNYSKNREKMMRCQMEIAEVLKKYMAEPE